MRRRRCTSRPRWAVLGKRSTAGGRRVPNRCIGRFIGLRRRETGRWGGEAHGSASLFRQRRLARLASRQVDREEVGTSPPRRPPPRDPSRSPPWATTMPGCAERSVEWDDVGRVGGMRPPAAAPRKRTEHVVGSQFLARLVAEVLEFADRSIRSLTQTGRRPALTIRRRSTTERTVRHGWFGVQRRVREDTSPKDPVHGL